MISRRFAYLCAMTVRLQKSFNLVAGFRDADDIRNNRRYLMQY